MPLRAGSRLSPPMHFGPSRAPFDCPSPLSNKGIVACGAPGRIRENPEVLPGAANRSGGAGHGQPPRHLAARADAHLAVDLTQVGLDRARADEQRGGRLVVGGPFQDHSRHARLGRRQVGPRRLLGGRLAAVAGGGELALGPLGPDLGAEGMEGRRGAGELLARVDAPAGPAQPLAIAQLGAGAGEGQRRAVMPLQRALRRARRARRCSPAGPGSGRRRHAPRYDRCAAPWPRGRRARARPERCARPARSPRS